MKKRWKIVASVVPVVVIVLIVAVFVLRSNQQAGIRMIKSDINLEAGEDAYQSCWAVGSHNFARAENGYYFMADNGKSLMYFKLCKIFEWFSRFVFYDGVFRLSLCDFSAIFPKF